MSSSVTSSPKLLGAKRPQATEDKHTPGGHVVNKTGADDGEPSRFNPTTVFPTLMPRGDTDDDAVMIESGAAAAAPPTTTSTTSKPSSGKATSSGSGSGPSSSPPIPPKSSDTNFIDNAQKKQRTIMNEKWNPELHDVLKAHKQKEPPPLDASGQEIIFGVDEPVDYDDIEQKVMHKLTLAYLRTGSGRSKTTASTVLARTSLLRAHHHALQNTYKVLMKEHHVQPPPEALSAKLREALGRTTSAAVRIQKIANHMGKWDPETTLVVGGSPMMDLSRSNAEDVAMAASDLKKQFLDLIDPGLTPAKERGSVTNVDQKTQEVASNFNHLVAAHTMLITHLAGDTINRELMMHYGRFLPSLNILHKAHFQLMEKAEEDTKLVHKTKNAKEISLAKLSFGSATTTNEFSDLVDPIKKIRFSPGSWDDITGATKALFAFAIGGAIETWESLFKVFARSCDIAEGLANTLPNILGAITAAHHHLQLESVTCEQHFEKVHLSEADEHFAQARAEKEKKKEEIQKTQQKKEGSTPQPGAAAPAKSDEKKSNFTVRVPHNDAEWSVSRIYDPALRIEYSKSEDILIEQDLPIVETARRQRELWSRLAARTQRLRLYVMAQFLDSSAKANAKEQSDLRQAHQRLQGAQARLLEQQKRSENSMTTVEGLQKELEEYKQQLADSKRMSLAEFRALYKEMDEPSSTAWSTKTSKKQKKQNKQQQQQQQQSQQSSSSGPGKGSQASPSNQGKGKGGGRGRGGRKGKGKGKGKS